MGVEMKMKLITESRFDVAWKAVDEDGKNLYIEGIFSSAEIMNENGRRYRKNILEREIDKMQDSIKNRCAWGELSHPACFSDSAKIYTPDGWKFIKDVKVGENVYTLNPETKNIEINPVNEVINSHYKGEMISFKGRSIDTMVTPNHRFLVYDKYNKPGFLTAEYIYENKHRPSIKKCHIPKTGNYVSENENDYYTIPGIKQEIQNGKFSKNFTNDLKLPVEIFCGFLGLFLAEGHTDKEKYRISIYQNEGKKADKIRSLLYKMTDVGWKERTEKNKVIWYVSDIRLHNYLKKLGTCYEKYIPNDVKYLPNYALSELIYWFNLGDGRTYVSENGYKQQNVFSTSEKLIDDLIEIMFFIGIHTVKTTKIATKDYIYADHLIEAKNKKPLYFANICTSKGIYFSNFMDIQKVDYEGSVHCVSVKNEVFFVKDNNTTFWTGNSPKINEDRIAILVESLKWDGDNVVGRAKVLPTPMGNIARTLIDHGRIGISSRGLGTVNETDNYVNDDYNLICYDLVSSPSNDPSWVKGIYEGKEFEVPDNKIEVVPEEKVEEKIDEAILLEEARKEWHRHIWQVIEQIERKL